MNITSPFSLERVASAVEKVRRRLLKAASALNKEARLMALSLEAGYRHAVRLTSPLEVEDEADE